MSEYKRLTNKCWKENYDIFEGVCCDTCTEDCGKCERNFNALVRLAELEDKIENGTLKEIPENAVVLTKEEYDKLGLFGETVQEYKSDNGQPILVKEQKKLKKYPTDIADFIQKKTVKEFVEKLKEKAYTNNYCQEVILKSDIDRLLKEYEK